MSSRQSVDADGHRCIDMPTPDPKHVLAGLLRTAGLDDAVLRDVALTGDEPVLPPPHLPP
jgi:hypothetical protein